MKNGSKLRRRSHISLTTRRAWTGILFISPWIIGFLGFFLRPLVNSFMYVFNSTTIRPNSLEMKFIGLDNLYRAFFNDTKFTPLLTSQLSSVVTSVPIILAFSLLMALIINGKFRGRTLVRAIFFLPVICGSGLILEILQGDAMSNSILSGTRSSMLFQTSGLENMLMNMGMAQELVDTMMGIVNNIFVLTWKSGIQILLFLAGLQTVSPSLYESAKIEGATCWETFWKVTFPLLGPCTGSMVILNGLGIWNDYLMPYLALPSGKAKTITVEIASFVGQYTARRDIVFAGTVISIVPALIIFCMFQKYFVKGITAGAAKG